jgi:hypothetical protein
MADDEDDTDHDWTLHYNTQLGEWREICSVCGQSK